MPFFEYVLLALIGSSGVAGPTPSTTLRPEAITQPNGGALTVYAQETPKKDDSRQSRTRAKHPHNRHHKGRHIGTDYTRHKKGSGKVQ